MFSRILKLIPAVALVLPAVEARAAESAAGGGFICGDETFYVHELWSRDMSGSVSTDDLHSIVSLDGILYLTANRYGSEVHEIRRVNAVTGEPLEPIYLTFTDDQIYDAYLDNQNDYILDQYIALTKDDAGNLVAFFDFGATRPSSGNRISRRIIYCTVDRTTGAAIDVFQNKNITRSPNNTKSLSGIGNPTVIGDVNGDHMFYLPVAFEDTDGNTKTAVYKVDGRVGNAATLSNLCTIDQNGVDGYRYDTSDRTQFHYINENYFVVDDPVNNIGLRYHRFEQRPVDEIPETEMSNGFVTFEYRGQRFAIFGSDDSSFNLASWEADLSQPLPAVDKVWEENNVGFDGLEVRQTLKAGSGAISRAATGAPHLATVSDYDTGTRKVANIHLYYPGVGLSAYQLSVYDGVTGIGEIVDGAYGDSRPIIFRGGTVLFPERCAHCQVFDVAGREVTDATDCDTLDLRDLDPGIYIIKAAGHYLKIHI